MLQSTRASLPETERSGALKAHVEENPATESTADARPLREAELKSAAMPETPEAAGITEYKELEPLDEAERAFNEKVAENKAVNTRASGKVPISPVVHDSGRGSIHFQGNARKPITTLSLEEFLKDKTSQEQIAQVRQLSFYRVTERFTLGRLDIAKSSLNVSIIQKLAAAENLDILKINDSSLTLMELWAISKYLNKVRVLDLSNTQSLYGNTTTAVVQANFLKKRVYNTMGLGYLNNIKNLEELSLRGTEIDFEDVLSLKDLPNLKRLDLRNNFFQYKQVQAFLDHRQEIGKPLEAIQFSRPIHHSDGEKMGKRIKYESPFDIKLIEVPDSMEIAFSDRNGAILVDKVLKANGGLKEGDLPPNLPDQPLRMA